MNYYILPKNNINAKINFLLTEKNLLKPFNSTSIIYFLNNINVQLNKIIDKDINEYVNTDYNINLISKIVNTYEFVFTNVPTSPLSVSKVKPDSNIFFELIEIFNICNINENFIKKNMFNLHISPNYSSSNYFLNIIREDANDININESNDIIKLYEKIVINNYLNTLKLDFIFFECIEYDYNDINKYIINMIFIFYLIIKYQNKDGISIIKINNILHKGIIDIIYLLTSAFDKIYLTKPLVSNIISGERFLVCKNFLSNTNSNHINNLEEFLYNSIHRNNISNELIIDSIIDNEISYLFMSKIEESNIVIAQQQLDAIDQIINIIKNKNKDEKIESTKRSHIQKCIQWCEKYNIPHNKFIDKLNIFLNTNNKNMEDFEKYVDVQQLYEKENIDAIKNIYN
jgi:hypothetical protein